MDNNTLLDNDSLAMNKTELIESLARMTQRTKQALMHNPLLAQQYYEKVQHLNSVVRIVTNFERQLLFDLDVD